MNARPLTDAQLSQALRAHLPEAAAPGLRERVFEAAETTSQLRALPSFLGALSDADPVGRRRSLLIAAALLVALAVASATAVGAWRLIQQDPVDKLSLEPPADVPAFVLSSYERLPQLQPVALTWHDSDSAEGRIYVDRSGTVRFDRFASADATEPSSSTILNADHRISGMAPVDDEAVWIEQGHEAIGEDPRVFLRTVLSAGDGPPGCEMERDPGEVGNGTAAAGWRYVGLEYIAGRPTHHVTCGGGDLWIDIETRLILRTQGPAVDDAGQPIPVESTEVTEIAFGEQPAALFEPPEGVTRMSADEYGAYLCTAGELPNEQVLGLGAREGCPTEAEATPQPEPEPSPTPTARPGPSDCAVPPGDPSEPIGPLAWNPESLKEDWPASVRPEAGGGGSVQPMPLTYLDPMGENGSNAYPCVDIRWVMADTSEVDLKLVSNTWSSSMSAASKTPVVDPTERWIAYGVVTDEDRDGVPDWRYGIDNMPADAAEAGYPPRRGWRTNLHTGQTEAGPGHDDPGRLNGGGFKSGVLSGSGGFSPDATFQFGGSVETAGQGKVPWGIELDMPFYTWASVIVNGRVVATDYAPDSGWLVATRGATPGGTVLLGDPYPHLSMTVPDGWAGGGGLLSRVECGDELPPDGRGDLCAVVGFEVIDGPEDLCSGAIKPPPGPSFDDPVTYFSGLPMIEISESADVTVDGFRGKHLQYASVQAYSDLFGRPEALLRLLSDVDCAEGRMYDVLMEGYNNVWILDVDGVHVLIFSESDKAEIRQMVESIHFER